MQLLTEEYDNVDDMLSIPRRDRRSLFYCRFCGNVSSPRVMRSKCVNRAA
jgi:hypothetical protein